MLIISLDIDVHAERRGGPLDEVLGVVLSLGPASVCGLLIGDLRDPYIVCVVSVEVLAVCADLTLPELHQEVVLLPV